MKKESGKSYGRYDDIIHLPRPVSEKHQPMSVYDRAAQFAPFAALTGHGDAIRETARLTESFINRSEDEIVKLDKKLRIVAAEPGAEVKLTYFRPDDRKQGGEYVTCRGKVKRIDEYEHMLIMEGGLSVPVQMIMDIECRQTEDICW